MSWFFLSAIIRSAVSYRTRACISNRAIEIDRVAADLLGDEQAVGARHRIGGQLVRLRVGEVRGEFTV